MSNNTQRASVALRHQIVSALTGAPGDSLVSLSTYEIPDGGEAFVVSTSGTYRLYKTLDPDDAPTGSPQYVAPLAGPGTWALQDAADASSSLGWDGTAAFTSAAPQAILTFNWHAMPTGTNFYENNADGPGWSMLPNTGILAYNGPAKRFLVTATFSVYCSTTESSFEQTVDIDLTKNAALLGTTTASQTSSEVVMGDVGFPSAVTHQLLVDAAPGDHFQHVLRTLIDADDSVGFTRYSVVITAA